MKNNQAAPSLKLFGALGMVSLGLAATNTALGQNPRLPSTEITIRVVDEKGNGIKGATVQILNAETPCVCDPYNGTNKCVISVLQSKETSKDGWAVFEGADFKPTKQYIAAVNAGCSTLKDCGPEGPSKDCSFVSGNSQHYISNEKGGYDKGILLELNSGKTEKIKPKKEEGIKSAIPEFELGLGGGYGFGMNGNLLGENKSFTTISSTTTGVYGSWAAGENFYLRPTFGICPVLSAGVELGYTYGKNYSWTTSNSNATSQSSLSYSGRYTNINATPLVVIYPYENYHIKPFLKLGVQFNLSNSIKAEWNQVQSFDSSTTTTNQAGTYKGTFSAGFVAGLGIDYKLGNNWALTGELNFSNTQFTPKTWTLTKYVVNGMDQLNSLDVYQKQTDYLKSLSGGSTTNPNAPAQALRYSAPASYLGIRLGISFSF
jgi:hypothetical protein